MKINIMKDLYSVNFILTFLDKEKFVDIPLSGEDLNTLKGLLDELI